MRKRNVRHKHRPKATRRPLRVILDFETYSGSLLPALTVRYDAAQASIGKFETLTGRYRREFPVMASLGKSIVDAATVGTPMPEIDYSEIEKRLLARHDRAISAAFAAPYGVSPVPADGDIYGAFATIMGLDLASGPDRTAIAIRGADGTFSILDKGEPDPDL